MTTVGVSNDAFIVQDGTDFYVVEAVRKYVAPGAGATAQIADAYSDIKSTFDRGKKLKAVRIVYEIAVANSGHQAAP